MLAPARIHTCNKKRQNIRVLRCIKTVSSDKHREREGGSFLRLPVTIIKQTRCLKYHAGTINHLSKRSFACAPLHRRGGNTLLVFPNDVNRWHSFKGSAEPHRGPCSPLPSSHRAKPLIRKLFPVWVARSRPSSFRFAALLIRSTPRHSSQTRYSESRYAERIGGTAAARVHDKHGHRQAWEGSRAPPISKGSDPLLTEGQWAMGSVPYPNRCRRLPLKSTEDSSRRNLFADTTDDESVMITTKFWAMMLLSPNGLAKLCMASIVAQGFGRDHDSFILSDHK